MEAAVLFTFNNTPKITHDKIIHSGLETLFTVKESHHACLPISLNLFWNMLR